MWEVIGFGLSVGTIVALIYLGYLLSRIPRPDDEE